METIKKFFIFFGLFFTAFFVGEVTEMIPFVKELGNWVFASGWVGGMIYVAISSE